MKAGHHNPLVERMLKTLAEAPLPDPLRLASARRAYLEQAARLRGGAVRPARSSLPVPMRWVRLAAACLLAAILSLGVLSGAALAADQALPGDLLYPLDLAMEDLRLASARTPQAKVTLLLELADERIEESGRLASRGEPDRMAEALEAYDQILVQISAALDLTGKTNRPGLERQLDQSLTVHEQRLQELRQQAPEKAWPGLDRAIEASQGVHSPQSGIDAEKTPGPPADRPGNGHDRRPAKTPPGQDGQRGNPHAEPTAVPTQP